MHVLGGADGYVYATRNWRVALSRDVVGVFDGSDIVADRDGAAAVCADFYAHGGSFDSVPFYSDGRNSFECDAIAVAPTPLPAPLGLFGAAVAGLGWLAAGAARRAERSRKSRRAARSGGPR